MDLLRKKEAMTALSQKYTLLDSIDELLSESPLR